MSAADRFDASAAKVGEQLTVCWNAASATLNSAMHAMLNGTAHVLRFVSALLAMLAEAVAVLDDKLREPKPERHELDCYLTPLTERKE